MAAIAKCMPKSLYAENQTKKLSKEQLTWVFTTHNDFSNSFKICGYD